MTPVDVVVCAHDEEATVVGVLEAIRGAPSLGALVVVADSCTDRTPELALPLADVLVEVEVRDKGSAMAAGLRKVTTRDVAFVDADLSGLAPHHVEALLTCPPPGAQVVGLRDGYPVGFGALPPISGERRLPTLLASEAGLEGAGWEAEFRINAAASKAGVSWSHVVMHGVTNPHRPKSAEYVQLGKGVLKHAPDLFRYWRSGRRVR